MVPMSPTDPRRRLDLSLTQVIAGALAAVSAAWAASTLGVAGTVIGAAVVSVTITVLSAVYQHGARRTAERLRALRRAELAGDPAAASLAADDEEFDLERTLVLPALDLEDERGYRWGRIALLSLGVFLLAMAAVTVFELSTGRTLACSAFGRDCEQRTTVTPGLPARTPPRPTPSATGQPSPSASATASASASSTASPSASASPTDSGFASPLASASPTGPLAVPSSTSSPTPATTVGPSASPSTG
jgi:hypothetical protein